MPRRPAILTTKTCEREECAQTFEVTSAKAQQARRYCSKDCSNKATAEARGAAYRASHGYVPPVCPCGKTIVAASKAGYAYTKKYCDDDCRRQYAPVRQKDPANYRTRNCENPNCGKEFTRYLKYGNGDTRFCSNACARKHTKTRRFYAVEEFDIVFESSYECFFWSACKIAKIPIERFDREYGVEWGDGKWYAPDFWLPEQQTAVEIKGMEDDHDQVRWAVYREQRGRLIVMQRGDLWAMTGGIASVVKP